MYKCFTNHISVSSRDLDDHVAIDHLQCMDYCIYQCHYCTVDGSDFYCKNYAKLAKHTTISHPNHPCKALNVRKHSMDSQLDAFINKNVIFIQQDQVIVSWNLIYCRYSHTWARVASWLEGGQLDLGRRGVEKFLARNSKFLLESVYFHQKSPIFH